MCVLSTLRWREAALEIRSLPDLHHVRKEVGQDPSIWDDEWLALPRHLRFS